MTVIQKSLQFILIHGTHLSRNFRHQSGEHQAWTPLPKRLILPCNMIQHLASESSCQEIREDQLRAVKKGLMEKFLKLKKDHEVRDNVQSHLVMTCGFCFSLTITGAWQAWHKLASTVVLRGRRGTDGTGWRAWSGFVTLCLFLLRLSAPVSWGSS